MLIDSHCHLPNNLEQAREIIKAANEWGVTKFINIGTNLKDSVQAAELAASLENVYSTAAVYPHEERELTLDQIKTGLEDLLTKYPKICALGECGIDISHWQNGRPVEEQKQLFELQVQLAIAHNLPIVLHDRNGDVETLEILSRYKNTDLRGIAHCFASSWDFAQKLLDLNFYLSFSGMITYPSRKELLDTVKNVPLGKFLVETDAPYLPPQGYRGQKNEPKYVRMVAQKVAEVRNLPLEEIEQHSFENTSRIFKI